MKLLKNKNLKQEEKKQNDFAAHQKCSKQFHDLSYAQNILWHM